MGENTDVPPRVELLAPAGTAAIGMAAIQCGADAVYIGAGRFGAREKAANPTRDIEALCRHAHKYWARVYAAVNTLLTDAELPQALGLIQDLYHAGVDGVIVQDPGLLELSLPPVPLIASTQMHNHTPERVAFLESVGFSRVILARELSLSQIAAIRGRTSVELECFIHGALCVGYSGQCYFSHAIGGRSANRGACAQPCRRPYRLVDGRGHAVGPEAHWLSLKDLNLSSDLAALLDAGVTAFKIEGRMKGRDYVINTTAHYRKLLDNLLEQRQRRAAASGKTRLDFTPDPERTFNRGFTRFFIQGRNRDMAALTTPKSLGAFMGEVASAGPDGFTLSRRKSAFHPGDGICFFNGQGGFQGTTVCRVEGDRVVPDRMDGIGKGVRIYRNHDHEFRRRLAHTRSRRYLRIRLALSETPEGVALSAVDEDGNRAEAVLVMEKQPARQPGAALETLNKQLRKWGAGDFACEDLTLDMPHPLFIPVGRLNDLRRRVEAGLMAERERSRPVCLKPIVKNNHPFPEQQLTHKGNVLNRASEAFYRRHGAKVLAPAPEAGVDLTGQVVMTAKYCLLFQLGACLRDPRAKQLALPLALVDRENRKWRVLPRCDACEMDIMMMGFGKPGPRGRLGGAPGSK